MFQYTLVAHVSLQMCEVSTMELDCLVLQADNSRTYIEVLLAFREEVLDILRPVMPRAKWRRNWMLLSTDRCGELWINGLRSSCELGLCMRGALCG